MSINRQTWFVVATAGLITLTCTRLQAADSCDAFKWDVTREVALYRSSPVAISAGTDSATAPEIEAERLYEITLQPQEKIRYLQTPGKKSLPEGTFGGLLRLHSADAGSYRIAIDSGYWLDAVYEGKLLPTLDFNSSHDCKSPHKIVVYEFSAGGDLVIQLSAASAYQVKLTVTPVTVKIQATRKTAS